MIAVILAAGIASRLRPLTNDTPKCLLDVKGKSLLERSMNALIDAGISEFVIVTGYLNQKIENFVNANYKQINVTFIHNDVYELTNNIYSLWLSRKVVDAKDFLLLDSDLLYDPQIVKNVLADKNENVLTLIRHELGEEEMKVVTDEKGAIVEISKTCDPKMAAGESLGIEKIGKNYSKALFIELDKMMNQEHLENKFYELAFERLIQQGHTYSVLDASNYFSCELDTVEDFENAKVKIPLQ